MLLDRGGVQGGGAGPGVGGLVDHQREAGRCTLQERGGQECGPPRAPSHRNRGIVVRQRQIQLREIAENCGTIPGKLRCRDQTSRSLEEQHFCTSASECFGVSSNKKNCENAAKNCGKLRTIANNCKIAGQLRCRDQIPEASRGKTQAQGTQRAPTCTRGGARKTQRRNCGKLRQIGQLRTPPPHPRRKSAGSASCVCPGPRRAHVGGGVRRGMGLQWAEERQPAVRPLEWGLHCPWPTGAPPGNQAWANCPPPPPPPSKQPPKQNSKRPMCANGQGGSLCRAKIICKLHHKKTHRVHHLCYAACVLCLNGPPGAPCVHCAPEVLLKGTPVCTPGTTTSTLFCTTRQPFGSA